MPIYEYRCPDCGKVKEEILPMRDRDNRQVCECGGVMDRMISLPSPAVFVITNRNRLVNTLNDDEKSFSLPGKAKHGERYKKVIGESLFNREKQVVGRGFGG